MHVAGRLRRCRAAHACASQQPIAAPAPRAASPARQIRAILALPVLVVLDEAYIEFSDVPSRITWVQQHDNLVVLRTFSKSAGARAGLP